MFRVHRAQAFRMIESKQAVQIDGATIQLSGGLSTIDRKGRDDSRRSQTSNKTTFIERLDAGRLIQHKHIEPQDEHLYRLAVTENLVSA